MYKYNQHNGRSGSWCRWSGTEISKPYDGKCPFNCPDSTVLAVKQHWHVNHNIPGYLPEADGVTTADWSEALESFKEEIGSFQEIWSAYCGESHATEDEYQDCANGGEHRCDWQELFVDGEADRVKLGEMAIPEGEVFTYIYNTPEGADVAIFLASCEETDCVMTWEDTE